jgi:hypothetical protein
VLEGFDVDGADDVGFATTRTSGFGVRPGELFVAEAGKYFSFQ